MLKQVRKSVDIPIVGIGGINPENISQLYGSGIEGGCRILHNGEARTLMLSQNSCLKWLRSCKYYEK